MKCPFCNSKVYIKNSMFEGGIVYRKYYCNNCLRSILTEESVSKNPENVDKMLKYRFKKNYYKHKKEGKT
jgi:transcriptional regulator NrdR family protein